MYNLAIRKDLVLKRQNKMKKLAASTSILFILVLLGLFAGCSKSSTNTNSNTYSLYLSANGNGIMQPAIGTHSYNEGTAVKITATPAKGWKFVGWSGDVSGNVSSTSIIMNRNKNIIANFSKIAYILTVAVKGNGVTSPAAGGYAYDADSIITISAIPDNGYRFDGWSGNVASPLSATTTVRLDQNITIIANFRKIPVPIIMLPKDDINIGIVLQRTSIQGLIELANVGDADLNIKNVDSPDFFLCKSALPLIIPAGKTAELEFAVNTQEAKTLDGTISLQTNDLKTPNQNLHIHGIIDPISIVAKERQETYLQEVSEDEPQYLTITDLGRKTKWQFHPLPTYSCEWLLKIANSGPGNSKGVLTASADKGKAALMDSIVFHLASKEEVTFVFNLPINFFPSVFGGYNYGYEFSKVTEEFLKERTQIDIYKVTKSGEEKLDTFLKESQKAKTWQQSDYYKPGSVNIALKLLDNQIVTASAPVSSPTSQPVIPSPVAIPKPTVALAPPAFDLDLSNIRESHSGFFTISINVTTRATLTNTGDEDAHDIRASIQAAAKSNGSVIKINDQNTYTVPLGDLPGKQSLEKDLSFNMKAGMSTALDLQNNGIAFKIDLISDEIEKKVTYDYP